MLTCLMNDTYCIKMSDFLAGGGVTRDDSDRIEEELRAECNLRGERRPLLEQPAERERRSTHLVAQRLKQRAIRPALAQPVLKEDLERSAKSRRRRAARAAVCCTAFR